MNRIKDSWTFLALALLVIAGLVAVGISSSARAASPVKITVGIMSAHGMSDSGEDIAKQFNELYGPGITVEVTAIGFDVLLDKMLTDFTTHARSFDVYSVGYHWMGTVGRYLADLDEIRKKYPDVVDKDYDFNDFAKILWQTYATWQGKNIGLPFVDGALTLFYRTDLFENAEYKAAFKKQYGYDLRMPKDGEKFRLTPKMLRDYAEFFTKGVKWREGEQYGISLPGRVGDPLLSTFCAFLGYYRRSPEGIKALGEVDPDWGDYFTKDHRPAFDPRITDIGMKALADYLALGKSSPNPANLDWITSSEPFRSGITAMFAGWGGYWPSITAQDSPIHGKVAVANLPTPHLGGWNVAINKDSTHPREAYLYIQLLTNKKNTKHLYDTYTETPTRLSTMTDKALKAKNPDLWVMAPALELISTRPKLPVLPKFEHAMAGTLGPIWAGKDPRQALIATADEWIKILSAAGVK